MSSRELADKIKIITPFAAAVAELSESLDDLAALDSSVAKGKKDLASIKAEQDTIKADIAKQTAALAEAKKNHEQNVADTMAKIARDNQAKADEFENYKKQQTALLAQARAKHESDLTMQRDAIAREAAGIVEDAQNEADAIRKEYSSLVPQTEAARAAYAEAKRVLDDINARIDSLRGR